MLHFALFADGPSSSEMRFRVTTNISTMISDITAATGSRSRRCSRNERRPEPA
jgi:hypothetical protein